MSLDAQPSSLGLRAIALLEGVPAERLDMLARECAWRQYGPGREIISRDADDDGVYLIVSGRVRVTTYSVNGRQVTFRDLGGGEYFGEVAAIDGMPRSAGVLALDSSLLASMPQAVFWRLLHGEPRVAERALRRLTALVRRLSDRVIDLSTLGVRSRVHAELLRLAREAGIARNAARIEPVPRYADIASQVSTSREQFTRELSALVRAGILERTGRALLVRDIARLERLVEELRGTA
jgi:CRP/FNR family transcriptional regulator, cyclic AMP receptor protein